MKALFSVTTDKILVLFLEHPKAQFYPNQIVHLTGKYPNSVNQSLKRLVSLHLLKKHKVGSYEFYSLNRDNPFLEEIKTIFTKMGLLKVPKWKLVLSKILSSSEKKVTFKDEEQACIIEDKKYRFHFSFAPDNNKLSGQFEIIEK